MPVTRRQLLISGAASASIVSNAGGIPRFLLEATAAAPTSTSNERVLVVVQLSGGNDGLNTVVPVGDDVYHRSRFQTRIAKGIRIDDYLSFHPSLKGLASLYDDGRLSVVQGVGYANPNRSHFESMDIWHTADSSPASQATGWIGRSLDATARDVSGAVTESAPAIHLGSEKQPLALSGLKIHVPSIASIDGLHLKGLTKPGVQGRIERLIEAPRSEANELTRFIQNASRAAVATSQQIHDRVAGRSAGRNYPPFPLAKKLRTVAQLIAAGLDARIYYVTLDGFDTHSEQADAHSALLRALGDSLLAFLDDLKDQGVGKETAVVCFSEFGRRVKENASRGTDHGTAAPVFVAGEAVHGGLLGDHPSLDELEDGDLQFHTDFRRVYATILDRWLRIDSKRVLNQDYRHLPIFAS